MKSLSVTRRSALGLAAASLSVATLRMRAAHASNENAYAVLLRKYVVASPDGINRVDYRRWHGEAADRAQLAEFIARQESLTPSALSRGDAIAFWANLYNAVTLKLILDNYPVKSIRDIRSQSSLLDVKALFGPWRTKFVTIEGKQLSLDDIEHGIMRPKFSDPRIHYAVNCASLGCPNLQPFPWSAASLDTDLDAAARAYVNHPRGVSVRSDGSLKISSIYKWFKEDFGGNDEGILKHLRLYAQGELAGRLKEGVVIAQDDYDWSLNGAGSGQS